ncbi:MAG: phosphatidylserine decarboxylase family protein [Bacteroidales bacterium]|nr:phosphatidylserine decarboxylase family protein [Bacteroidales bacterium]
MYIHKEGRKLIAWMFAAIALLCCVMLFVVQQWTVFHYLFMTILLVVLALLVYFFRIPNRVFTQDENSLIAPADGVVVTRERTFVKEYINDYCLQLSIFMNGTDVHVNRYPASGKVDYVKYHKGNYFMASYPKSSILNEHSSVGMVLASGQKILIRQVAGVMARRIVCYSHEGDEVKQNQEMGFIKFGSRVDIFLPENTEISVDIQDVVRNGVTPVARIAPPATNPFVIS